MVMNIVIYSEYLPDIERIVQQREKQFKKKMLAELPRRTSDRIAIKAAQKIEEVGKKCMYLVCVVCES